MAVLLEYIVMTRVSRSFFEIQVVECGPALALYINFPTGDNLTAVIQGFHSK